MPRKNYAQHRAAVAQSRDYRGSAYESETELESLASYSTYASSSNLSSQSPLLASYLEASPRQRTLSSSSSSFTAPDHNRSSPLPHSHPFQASLTPIDSDSPLLSKLTTSSTTNTGSKISPVHSSSLSPGSAVRRVSETPAERMQRRRKRREERERKSTLKSDVYDSPLRRYARWMGHAGEAVGGWKVGLGVGLIAVGMVKSAVGINGFSGQDTPPMYGDFEAQRHWMELTLHLPLKEWYTFGPDWWQLDYPPLTAYVSYLCGWLGAKLDPTHFELDSSRGLSPPALVTYMRGTVLVLEMLVWWTAVVAWVMVEAKKSGRTWRSQITGILTVLLQPSLTLVDNGHFQYNSVLLGFSVYTLLAMQTGHDLWACVAFSLALGFKQMGLYFAPAVGCYLVGKCLWLGWPKGVIHFIKLGVVTSSTMIALFSPWIFPFPDALLWVFHRMFPFARGIFEDKVANFWCASNVVLKWRRWFDVSGMARLATIATLASLLPTIIILIRTSIISRDTPSKLSSKTNSKPLIRTFAPSSASSPSSPCPTARLVPLAFLTSSLSFFLFSFQVHEKSILIALVPATLMMALRRDDEVWEVGVIFNNVAVFSMWPLLKRDGQILSYAVLPLLWNYLIGADPRRFRFSLKYMSYLIYGTIAILHAAEALVPPPKRLPDLYTVINVLLSGAVFGCVWLWACRRLVVESWALGGLRGI